MQDDLSPTCGQTRVSLISKCICIDDIIFYMPSILIQLDDATYRALNQIPQPLNGNGPSSSVKPSRRQFAGRNTHVFVKAYRKQPDSAADSDDWSSCEKFEA